LREGPRPTSFDFDNGTGAALKRAQSRYKSRAIVSKKKHLRVRDLAPGNVPPSFQTHIGKPSQGNRKGSANFRGPTIDT